MHGCTCICVCMVLYDNVALKAQTWGLVLCMSRYVCVFMLDNREGGRTGGKEKEAVTEETEVERGSDEAN